MKIGVLTFHKSINYGSVLQAFALTTVLKEQGHDCEIIDYETKMFNDIYYLFEKNNSIRNIGINLLRYLPAKKWYDNRNQAFKDFVTNCLPISKEKYFYDSDITNLDKKYEAIICGSDQIWNIRTDDSDDFYFLPHKLNLKKIAYAASINTTDFTECRADEQLKSWINDFDHISIRENSGVDKVKKFIDRENVVNTIDPTFLLSRNKYKEIESKRFLDKPYIFMFTVSFENSTVESALLLSKRTGLPVYSLNTTNYSFKYVRSNEIHILKDHLSPRDFIRYIDDASYVVTDSFHGTAFSLIFNKQFFSINDEINGKVKNDERLTNILGKFNILNRLVTVKELSEYNLDEVIDYTLIEQVRTMVIEESMSFLVNALK